MNGLVGRSMVLAYWQRRQLSLESCVARVDPLSVRSRWSLSGKTGITRDLLLGHVPLTSLVLPPGVRDTLRHLFLWLSYRLRCSMFLLFLLRLDPLISAKWLGLTLSQIPDDCIGTILDGCWLSGTLHLHLIVCLSKVDFGELLPPLPA